MNFPQTASRRHLDDLFHSMLHGAFQGHCKLLAERRFRPYPKSNETAPSRATLAMNGKAFTKICAISSP